MFPTSIQTESKWRNQLGKLIRKAKSLRVSQQTQLCANCQKIDFWNADSAPTQEFHTTFSFLEYQQSMTRCSLCTLIMHRLSNCRISGFEEQATIPITLRLRGNQAYVWSATRNFGKIRPLGEHETDLELYDDRDIDVDLIKRWLKTCDTEHHEAQRSESPVSIILIDTHNYCLVRRSSQELYIALSYVWGGANQLEATMSNFEELRRDSALLGQSLPMVLRDAINLTIRLGLRFLWVDSLCIIQDSREKHSDILKMDKVYSHSYLTVIALDGKSADTPLPGVAANSRLPIYKSAKFNGLTFVSEPPDYVDTHIVGSVYETRGWTLQERLLSSRILYFTAQQVIFQCGTMFCTESKASRHGQFKRTKSGIPVSWRRLQLEVEGIEEEIEEDLSGTVRPGSGGGVLVGRQVSQLARMVEKGRASTTTPLPLPTSFVGTPMEVIQIPIPPFQMNSNNISTTKSSREQELIESKVQDSAPLATTDSCSRAPWLLKMESKSLRPLFPSKQESNNRRDSFVDPTPELSSGAPWLLSMEPKSLPSLFTSCEDDGNRSTECIDTTNETFFSSDKILNVDSPSTLAGRSTLVELFLLYQNVVEMYTARSLTYESDILRAFSGISAMLSKVCNSRFIHGMPATVLASSLLWGSKGRTSRRLDVHGRPIYPSWCWAGWIGAVTYPPVVRGMTKDFSNHVKFVFPSVLKMRVREIRGKDQEPGQGYAVLTFRIRLMPCTPILLATGSDESCGAAFQTFSVGDSRYSCGVFFGCMLPNESLNNRERYVIIPVGMDSVLFSEFDIRTRYGLTYPLSNQDGGQYRGRTLYILLLKERGQFYERVACGKMLEKAFDKQCGLQLIELW